ncbi:flagellin [Quadrisphaera granulorum]|uniref:Flagellin n=1 Tax=Quadrisphaera granulorum TaxID=317664 RepID=A0A316A4W9_9ACTN|nr:flagellin [Quadrisphaera granulorum]PWJ52603.1 flagellin [Quadrisphaera granulorum]SZE97653.1 flagellin [Quadrisphaera granulorum]
MALTVNSNIQALNAYRNLNKTQAGLSSSLEKLSSGLRINRAADDAAGLAISEGLKAQIGGIQQASRNAQDGVSLVQTADGALSQSQAILQRLRTLAVQSSNGSQSADSRTAINAEATALKAELTRISDTSSFNSVNLLDGTYKTGYNFQIGYKADGASATGNQIAVSIDSGAAAASAVTAVTAQAQVLASLTGTGTFANATSTDYSASETTLRIKVNGVTMNFSVSGTFASTANDAVAASIVTLLNTQAGSSLTFSYSATTDQFTVTAAGAALGVSSTIEVVAATVATGGLNLNLAAASNTGVASVNAVAAASAVAAGAFSAGGLGVASLDLTTQSTSQSAITAIDDAIKKVSTARASLGALQNRFQYTVDNLDTTAENLSAAQSRITDTDMASEMVSFTRAQILSQAGTSMLSQAKNLPSSILDLLRG